MARKKKQLILTQPVRKGIKAIKVRLDHRTVITLSDLKKLAFWKERYPKAEVIVDPGQPACGYLGHRCRALSGMSRCAFTKFRTLAKEPFPDA